MVRTIVYDERIEKELQRLASENIWSIGCLVGEVNENKDQLVWLPRTPVELKTGESGDCAVPNEVSSVRDELVVRHAHQVLHMLPGGLDVIGVYLIAPTNVLGPAANQLRKLVFTVESALEDPYRITKSPDRHLLQFDTTTKKVTCQSLNTSDSKSSPRTVELKLQKNTLDRWLTLETTVTLDTVLNIPITMQSKSLKKQLMTSMKPICDNLWNSLGIVNDGLYEDDEALCPSQHGKHRRADDDQLHFNVELFTQNGMLNKAALKQQEEEEEEQVTECCAKMYLRGTMSCRAFTNGRATAKEGLQALKMDIVRSLLRRCELLCEDLLQSEEEQDPKILYETPRRVFVRLPGTPLQLTDYVFMDEVPDDVTQRIRDLLNVDITADEVEFNVERLPEEPDLIKPQASFTSVEDMEEQPKLYRPMCSVTTAVTLLSLCVGGTAMAISYLYMKTT